MSDSVDDTQRDGPGRRPALGSSPTSVVKVGEGRDPRADPDEPQIYLLTLKENLSGVVLRACAGADTAARSAEPLRLISSRCRPSKRP